MSEDTTPISPKIKEIQARLASDPTSRIFVQLTEEFRKGKQYDEAVKVCITGLEKHPGYTTARVTLGRAYMEMNRLAEATSEFETVVAAVPDNLLANRNLGDIYYAEGRNDEAVQRYRIVQMLNPTDDEVSSRLQQLESGGPAVAAPALPAAAPAPTAPAPPSPVAAPTPVTPAPAAPPPISAVPPVMAVPPRGIPGASRLPAPAAWASRCAIASTHSSTSISGARAASQAGTESSASPKFSPSRIRSRSRADRRRSLTVRTETPSVVAISTSDASSW